MSIVREHIYEKFTENSDPIKDLGIGIYDFWKKERKRIGAIKIGILCIEYFPGEHNCTDMVSILYDTLVNVVEKHSEPQEAFDSACVEKNHFYHYDLEHRRVVFKYARQKVAKVLKDHFKMIVDPHKKVTAKFLTEKFMQDSDPIKDLDIGAITWESLKAGDILKTKNSFGLISQWNKGQLCYRFVKRLPERRETAWISKNQVLRIEELERNTNDILFIRFSILIEEDPKIFSYTRYAALISREDFEEKFTPINKWELKDKIK